MEKWGRASSATLHDGASFQVWSEKITAIRNEIYDNFNFKLQF